MGVRVGGAHAGQGAVRAGNGARAETRSDAADRGPTVAIVLPHLFLTKGDIKADLAVTVLADCAGGHLVIATWCQREETVQEPFTQKDKDDLQFLYDEWTHPHFISKEEYCRIMQVPSHLISAVPTTKPRDACDWKD